MLTYGKDSNDNVIPLLLDASGQILIASSEPSAINPVGFFAYLQNDNLPAGTSLQTVYTVSTGQRFRVTQLIVRYYGTVAGVTLYLEFVNNSVGIIYDVISVPVNAKYYSYPVDVLLEAGGIFRVTITGATLNDDFLCGLFMQRYK